MIVLIGRRSCGGVLMTDILGADQRHVESAGDWRRGEGEAVDSGFDLFKCSLALTPNRCSSSMMMRPRSLNWTSLLMIRWVPMRISILSFFRSFQRLFDLFGGAEAGEDADCDGKIRSCARKRSRSAASRALLWERGRLLASSIDYGFKCSAHGDLCFAVADIAADESVHRLQGFMSC